MIEKKKEKTIETLIKEIIEIWEDHYLSKLAEEAEKRAQGKPTVSSEEFFRELGLI